MKKIRAGSMPFDFLKYLQPTQYFQLNTNLYYDNFVVKFTSDLCCIPYQTTWQTVKTASPLRPERPQTKRWLQQLARPQFACTIDKIQTPFRRERALSPTRRKTKAGESL